MMSARMSRALAIESLEARCLLHGGAALVAASSAASAGEGEAAAMPDFTLTDVNPASSTGNRPVSPRDYLEQVSGWYFGHAM